jgi:hypothetical protein
MSLALYRPYQHVESFSRFVARDVRSYLAEDLHDDSLVILAACLVPDDG